MTMFMALDVSLERTTICIMSAGHEAVLRLVGRWLPEHGRLSDDAHPDRGGEPEDVLPALGDGVGAD